MLNTAPANWTRTKGADLFDHLELRREIYLADGGIYDNLGLEAIWKRYETVLVSDAGAPFEVQNRPKLLKISQVKKTLRVLDITVNQTRALRKRHLISDFINGTRKGTYWGIATEIGNYGMDALVRDNDNTRSLQTIRTRLNRFTKKEQGQLINWGMLLPMRLCDGM
jgi:NTE family protein